MFPTATIINYVFWMVLGAMQVVVIMGIRQWAKEYDIYMTWRKTFLCYGWFVALCLTIAAGYTIHGEYEGNAGWYIIGVFGSVVLMVGAVIAKFAILPRR